MHGQPHLARRGAVYQWRRKISRFSTKTVQLRVSLRTTDRRLALILARTATAASEKIVEQILEDALTPKEARAWLEQVIRNERNKIEKLEMLKRFDSPDPEDDTRHDTATRMAWEHMARFGLHGEPPEGTDRLVRYYIELFRQDLMSETRRNIVTREFQELTGHEHVSAFDLVKLMNLVISGKRAAWAGCESVLEPIEKLADQLAQQAPSTLIGAEGEDAHPAIAVQAEQADTTLQADPLPDPAIAAVIERMVDMKRNENIEEKTLRQYQSFGDLFTQLTGIADVREIRQADAKEFRATLQKIPKSWGKSPGDRAASRDQVMARAAALPGDKVGLSTGTINRHLEHLGQMVEWAADEGHAVDPRLNPSKLRRRDTTRASAKRDAFTPAQVERLFRSPVWTGSKSEHNQTQSGPDIYRNGLFWCPLIGAVTGARREEIAGLSPSDIIDVDGIPCISIDETEQRRIKNQPSCRIVPIHSRLIDLGFLEHVENSRRTGRPDLFPDLREPRSGLHGRKLGRRMRQIIDDTFGAEGSRLSFHSFRHYVQNALEHAGIEDKIIRDIVGHEGKDVHDKVYHKPTPPALMRPAIEELVLLIGL